MFAVKKLLLLRTNLVDAMFKASLFPAAHLYAREIMNKWAAFVSVNIWMTACENFCALLVACVSRLLAGGLGQISSRSNPLEWNRNKSARSPLILFIRVLEKIIVICFCWSPRSTCVFLIGKKFWPNLYGINHSSAVNPRN